MLSSVYVKKWALVFSCLPFYKCSRSIWVCECTLCVCSFINTRLIIHHAQWNMKCLLFALQLHTMFPFYRTWGQNELQVTATMFLFNSHWLWVDCIMNMAALCNTPFFCFFTIWLMLFVFGVFICFFHFLKLWNCFHWCLYTINKYIHCPNPECKALKRLLHPFYSHFVVVNLFVLWFSINWILHYWPVI